MKFSDIVGQQKMKEHFRTAISAGKVGHAYIIEGPKSSGKMLMAKALAQTLLCENGGTEPCCSCPACAKAESGNHPDLIYVTHEKPNAISVDEIRTQVVEDIAIKPYEGRRKIYIIDDADRMNPNAQNAILKTIEEPPAYGLILLLTDNANNFLQTIRSRCLKLAMTPATVPEISKFLQEKHGLAPGTADIYAGLAQGSVGLAVNLAFDDEKNNLRESVLAIMGNIMDCDASQLCDYLDTLRNEKDNILEILDIMTIWFRDVLLYKSVGQIKDLIYREKTEEIIKTAQNCSYAGVTASLEAIDSAKARLRFNVNYDLIIELLLRTFKEKL